MISPEHASIRIQRLVVGQPQTNCYLLVCARTLESVILDPGAEPARILEAIKPTTPRYILFTHGHRDHTGALEEIQWRLSLPVGVHPADAVQLPMVPDLLLEDGGLVKFGLVELKVLHLPGHTPGSVAFSVGGRLLSGDTVFPGGPGRTRSLEDFQTIMASIRDKILPLPETTRVLPGHGAGTTVEEVRRGFASLVQRQDVAVLCGDVTWFG